MDELETFKKNATHSQTAVILYYQQLLQDTKSDVLHLKLLSRIHHVLESTKGVYEYRKNIPFFVELFTILSNKCETCAELKEKIEQLSKYE